MMETVLRRPAIITLIAVAAGCGYDSNGPESYDAPPVADANEGLWIASGINPALLRLAPSQLLSNGRQIASTTVTTSSVAPLAGSALRRDDGRTVSNLNGLPGGWRTAACPTPRSSRWR